MLRIFMKVYLKDKEISADAEAGNWKAVIGFSPVTTPTVPESGSPRTPRKINIHRLHRSAYIPISQTIPHGGIQSPPVPGSS